MPRASWAINRFLIFSPSISWVSVSDGWCDRGRRLHKFRILNTKSASGCWVLGAQFPLFLERRFYGDSVPQPCPSWGLAAAMTHEQAVGPHAITLAHNSSIWIPGSGKMGFRKARDPVQGHTGEKMSLRYRHGALVSSTLKVGAVFPFCTWENWASGPLISVRKVTRSAHGRGEIGTTVSLYPELTFL